MPLATQVFPQIAQPITLLPVPAVLPLPLLRHMRFYENYLLANYSSGLLGYYPLGDSVGASAAKDYGASAFNSTAQGTGVTYGNSAAIGNTQKTSVSDSGASAQTYIQLENATGTRFRANPFSFGIWFKRAGAGVTANSGTGGITGEPLLSKGGAESETSGVNMNYGFVLETIDTSLYLSADFEKDNSGVLANYPTGRNARMIDCTCDASTDFITTKSNVGLGADWTHGFANGERVRFGGTTVPTGITGGTWYFIINKTATTFQISTSAGGGAVNFTTNGSAVWLNHAKASTVLATSDTAWHFAICTWDGTNLKSYLDAVLVENETPTMVPPESATAQLAAIGAFVTSAAARSGAFNGKLQHAAIWNVTLTQSDVTNLYQVGTALWGAGTSFGTSDNAGTTLTGIGALTGTVAGTVSQAAALTGKGALAGTSAGTVAFSAALRAKGALAGTIAGTCAPSATIRGLAPIDSRSPGSETFSLSGDGSWAAPAGVTTVTVECWGGGGRGGPATGRGGGGGAYSKQTISVTAGNNYSYHVGAGGTGDIPSDGEQSWFVDNATVMAEGGTIGAGGDASTSIGTTKFSGGPGGNDGVGGGGGGGSSAGTASDGNAGGDGDVSDGGVGATAPTGGGNGGNGGPIGTNGDSGGAPGGGGGGCGALTSDSGGNGAAGQIALNYVGVGCLGTATVSGSMLAVEAATATVNGTSTVTGAMSGKGALTGTSAGTVSFSAAMTGKGALAGTSAGTVSLTGTLRGNAAFSGSSAGTVSLTAALTGKGALTGASAGTSSLTASLSGRGALGGTSAGTVSVSGSLIGNAAISGAITGQGSVAGSLSGIASASASSAGTSSVSAAITAKGALIATVSGVSSVTGSAAGLGGLAATSAGTSSLTAGLTGKGALASSVNCSCTSNGSATGSGACVGSVSGTSTVSGHFEQATPINGTANGQATITAHLTGRASMSATVSGSATITGNIGGLARTTASVSGTATVTGNIRANGRLSGSITATVSTSGALRGTGALAGVSSGIASGSGVLRMAILMTGIPSAEALGSPQINQRVRCGGVSSGEVFGQLRSILYLVLTGIGSGEASGNPRFFRPTMPRPIRLDDFPREVVNDHTTAEDTEQQANSAEAGRDANSASVLDSEPGVNVRQGTTSATLS